jgi:SAM-dependent methyltransferase
MEDGVEDISAISNQSKIKAYLREKFFINPIIKEFKGYVLDIGCGVGSHLKAYNGPHLGIDANTNNINKCIECDINALEADANYFVNPNTFDTILLSHVLEHFIHPCLVLENANTSLKRGGRIIIVVPCLNGFISGYNDLIGHKQFITEDYVDHHLIKRLKLVKIKSYKFPLFSIPFLSKYQELRLIYSK